MSGDETGVGAGTRAVTGGRAARWIVLAASLWLPVFVAVVYALTPVHLDTFQNAGAVVGAAEPGRIGWPMMGDWRGYGSEWGFHWFGPAWLRSWLLPVLPWHPLTDTVLGGLCWGGAAVLAAHGMVRFGGRIVPALLVGCTVLVTTSVDAEEAGVFGQRG